MSAHPLTSLGEKKAGREVGFGVAVLATGVNPCFMCRKELECSPDQGLWGQLSMLSMLREKAVTERETHNYTHSCILAIFSVTFTSG